MTEGKMEELLPCPFCGAQPEYLSVPGGMWVRCPECKASSDDSAALQKWNRRALKEAEAYIEEYELDDGEAHHVPNEVERLLMIDMVNGLFSEDSFILALRQALASPHAEPAPVVRVTNEMVTRSRLIYLAKVDEYNRDFELEDQPEGFWERKYGTNLHSTSLGQDWAMRAALTAALSLPVEGAAKEGERS